MPLVSIREEIENAIRVYESLIQHAATRTREMIARHGEIEALSRLMISPDLQQGFKALRDRGQLDQSFEAIVVRFAAHFRPDVVQAAQWRLDNPNHLL